MIIISSGERWSRRRGKRVRTCEGGEGEEEDKMMAGFSLTDRFQHSSQKQDSGARNRIGFLSIEGFLLDISD